MKSDAASSDALAGVARRLRPVLRELDRAVDRQLSGTGLTAAAWAALELLADHGPQTVPDVARAWVLGRQNVQRIVDRLLTLGLVQRIENPAHRRSARIGLSPPGADAVRALRQREQEGLRQIAIGLAQSDVDACRRVLDHLEAGLRLADRPPAETPLPARM
jgi:DNA-binding MarR family transcriptional regulator